MPTPSSEMETRLAAMETQLATLVRAVMEQSLKPLQDKITGLTTLTGSLVDRPPPPPVDLSSQFQSMQKQLDAMQKAAMSQPITVDVVMRAPEYAEARTAIRAKLLHDLQGRLSPLLAQAVNYELAGQRK